MITTTQMPSISDALKVVVQKTEDAIVSNTNVNFGNIAKKVYFMHGHPKEIVQVLQSYTNSPTKKNQKYPLVALFRDVSETINQQNFGVSSSFRCRIVICTLTKNTHRADTREAVSFKPILIPIFEEFIRQITLSPMFGTPTIDSMNITKWDRYFWGSQPMEANQFNDYIDAIEIEGISLKLINNICVEERINF